eukprot:UN06576
MEHHSKARRVGMRDVSKNRAHKIHKAHRKKDKAQKKEIESRAKEEKKLNKIKEDGSYNVDGHLAASAHGQQDSQLELEQYRKYSKEKQYAASAYGQEAYKPPQHVQRQQQAQSVHSRSHGNSSASDNLPYGWKIYYNNNGVPYYFNANTG